jgi:hypothetical protein
VSRAEFVLVNGKLATLSAQQLVAKMNELVRQWFR